MGDPQMKRGSETSVDPLRSSRVSRTGSGLPLNVNKQLWVRLRAQRSKVTCFTPKHWNLHGVRGKFCWSNCIKSEALIRFCFWSHLTWWTPPVGTDRWTGLTLELRSIHIRNRTVILSGTEVGPNPAQRRFWSRRFWSRSSFLCSKCKRRFGAEMGSGFSCLPSLGTEQSRCGSGCCWHRAGPAWSSLVQLVPPAAGPQRPSEPGAAVPGTFQEQGHVVRSKTARTRVLPVLRRPGPGPTGDRVPVRSGSWNRSRFGRKTTGCFGQQEASPEI